MPAHFPFPNVDMASGYRKDFKDHFAEVMPEMGQFCADRLRLDAKVFWISAVFRECEIKNKTGASRLVSIHCGRIMTVSKRVWF